MTVEFTPSTPEARRVWQNFLRRLDWANRDLDADARDELCAEAATHIRDAMDEMDPGDETARLKAAIASFGDLPDAPPAWRRPAAIVLHYGSILTLGVAGVFTLILAHMAVMEILNPQAVGLWHFAGGDWALSYEAQAEAEEVLGGWFIPVASTVCALVSALLFGLWRFAVAPGGPVSRWMKN